jgi:hypothetical protein
MSAYIAYITVSTFPIAEVLLLTHDSSTCDDPYSLLGTTPGNDEPPIAELSGVENCCCSHGFWAARYELLTDDSAV